MSTWNGNNFSIYKSEEKQVLKLIKELGDQVNYNTDNKTDKTGNHEGSWQGINKPTQSQEGLAGTVEKLIVDVDDLSILIPKPYGIDDTLSIQSVFNIASGKKIRFRSGIYVISDTIQVPSNVEIELSENTIIRAKNNLNIPLFRNDEINGNENINIHGGIFDGNGSNQTNSTTALMFKKIDGLKIKDIIIRNTYGLGTNLGNIENFEIENIKFDQDGLSPNQDGIHISGYANKGYIKHIHGTTFDDMIALNADDDTTAWSMGAITNIIIDDIQSDSCYRAIRLLSATSLIDRIVIKNVNTNTTNGLIEIGNNGLTTGNGNFGEITIDGLTGIPDVSNGMIKINGNIRLLKISNINRNDELTSPIINFSSGFTINTLTLDNIDIVERSIVGATQFILFGNIDDLFINNVRCDKNNFALRNFLIRGTIGHILMNNIKQNKGQYLVELNSPAIVKSLEMNNINTVNTENVLYSEVAIPVLNLSNIAIDGGNIPIQFNGLTANCRIKGFNINSKNTVQGGRDNGKKDFYFSALSGISIDGDISTEILPNNPMLYDSFIFTGVHATLTRGKIIWNGTKFKNLNDGTTN